MSINRDLVIPAETVSRYVIEDNPDKLRAVVAAVRASSGDLTVLYRTPPGTTHLADRLDLCHPILRSLTVAVATAGSGLISIDDNGTVHVDRNITGGPQ